MYIGAIDRDLGPNDPTGSKKASKNKGGGGPNDATGSKKASKNKGGGASNDANAPRGFVASVAATIYDLIHAQATESLSDRDTLYPRVVNERAPGQRRDLDGPKVRCVRPEPARRRPAEKLGDRVPEQCRRRKRDRARVRVLRLALGRNLDVTLHEILRLGRFFAFAAGNSETRTDSSLEFAANVRMPDERRRAV